LNGRKFDSHFVIRNLGKDLQNNVSIIPTNEEKFLQIKVSKSLHFNDCVSFFNASLEDTVKSMKELSITEDHFKEKANLFKRKGVVCFDVMNSLDCLKWTAFPIIDKFADILSDEKCDEEDFNHAKKVYDEMKCNAFGEYLQFFS